MARHHLLAGPGLAGDQDVRVARRDAGDLGPERSRARIGEERFFRNAASSTRGCLAGHGHVTLAPTSSPMPARRAARPTHLSSSVMGPPSRPLVRLAWLGFSPIFPIK